MLYPTRSKAISTASVLGSAGALIGALVIGGAPANAQQCSISLSGVPDFDQKRVATGSVPGLPNGGDMYCAPTSATNWFAFIANHGMPEVMDGPRDWQSQNNYDFVTDRIAYVGELMNTDPVDGTTWGAWPGTVAYLNEAAPGAFTVSGQVAALGLYPTPEMLHDAMANGGLVNITLGRYERNEFGAWNRVGGHVTSLTAVTDGCSNLPEVKWNNPSTGNSDDKTTQSTFKSQTSEMDEVTDQWATPPFGWGAQGTMWRFLSYKDEAQQRFLDSFMVITPTVVLTTDDQWDTVEVNSPGAMNDGEEEQNAAEDSPNGAPFDAFDFNPLWRRVFYATTEEDDESSVLYEYDPWAELLREVMRLRYRTPIATGRHGHLYLIDDGRLLQLDIAHPGNKPAVLHSYDLKGQTPDAMVYDDTADELTLLFADQRRLATFAKDLTGMRDQALPRDVVLRGKPLMANTSLDDTVWLGSGESNVFYELSTRRSEKGEWQIAQTVQLPAVQKPTALQISEAGNLVLVVDGIVREFGYDAKAKRWSDAQRSYIAGMRAGRHLVMSRSRNNFDAKTMSGPGWTNYATGPEDQKGEVPHCPADLSGGGKPDDPSWGLPNGVVDEADLIYFREQMARNNRRVADVTTSNDPRDPLFGVPDGFLNEQDVKFFEALHARSLGPCPR
ncbi:MAG: hypothetical protein H6970_13435 [Gammaproteobacteria bacterium]|nr:hypothetical protein [Gammaproteobacteria bacterium]